MAANNFLDQAGLSYLWTKIVAAIESHSVTLPDKLVSYKAATAITATEKLNADTLGGYSASYFAKGSDVSSIQGSIKTQASEILKAQQAVSSMESTVRGHTTSIGLLDSNVESLKTIVGSHRTSIENLQKRVGVLGQSIGDISDQVNTAIDTKLDKSGGTMTGPLIAKVGSDQTVAQVRNIIISTEEPTSEDGSNGDIWIRYTE